MQKQPQVLRFTLAHFMRQLTQDDIQCFLRRVAMEWVEGIPPKRSLDGAPVFLCTRRREEARKNTSRHAQNGAKVGIWEPLSPV